MNHSATFGAILKERLKEAALLQADFAKAIGVESKYPSHLVTGRRTPAGTPTLG